MNSLCRAASWYASCEALSLKVMCSARPSAVVHGATVLLGDRAAANETDRRGGRVRYFPQADTKRSRAAGVSSFSSK
jgi:hypothetical protein